MLRFIQAVERCCGACQAAGFVSFRAKIFMFVDCRQDVGWARQEVGERGERRADER